MRNQERATASSVYPKMYRVQSAWRASRYFAGAALRMGAMRVRLTICLRAGAFLLLGSLLLVSRLLLAHDEPTHVDLINQGNELARQEKWKEAAELYQKAVALKPESPEAHYSLASAYGAQQQLDRKSVV